MAKNKKYWYIQLNVNFFEDDAIDWLCEQKNGYEYIVLYLKLCLKTANNNGILNRKIGDMIIPYDFNKIAEVTKMKLDTVLIAFELFKKIGLVYEADENNNFMRLPAVPKMVGYTTQWAIDKAKSREKQKQLALKNKDNKQVPKQLIEEHNTSNIDNKQRQATSIINFYEENIGTLASTVFSDIKYYLNKGVEDKLIITCLKIAVDNNKRNWSYTRAIIKNLLSKGITTQKQYDVAEVDKNANKQVSNATQFTSNYKPERKLTGVIEL